MTRLCQRCRHHEEVCFFQSGGTGCVTLHVQHQTRRNSFPVPVLMKFDRIVSVFIKTKSETGMTASVLKQDPNT